MSKLTMRSDLTPIDQKCVELGISRLELARRSGVSPRTLEAWGKRLRVPRDAYVLRKVAKALDCHIEDLLDPNDPDEKNAPED